MILLENLFSRFVPCKFQLVQIPQTSVSVAQSMGREFRKYRCNFCCVCSATLRNTSYADAVQNTNQEHKLKWHSIHTKYAHTHSRNHENVSHRACTYIHTNIRLTHPHTDAHVDVPIKHRWCLPPYLPRSRGVIVEVVKRIRAGKECERQSTGRSKQRAWKDAEVFQWWEFAIARRCTAGVMFGLILKWKLRLELLHQSWSECKVNL